MLFVNDPWLLHVTIEPFGVLCWREVLGIKLLFSSLPVTIRFTVISVFCDTVLLSHVIKLDPCNTSNKETSLLDTLILNTLISP